MSTTVPRQCVVHLKKPHDKQLLFLRSPAKRKIIRAGRRGGKTTGLAILAVEEFLKGRRILYGAPTAEQIARFWTEVKMALREPVEAGAFTKNETLHIIEREGTEQRIRAKTAWNADTLRGDYADLLILDEWQLMDEQAWETVGAPMLLDNNGDAVFIYTPPSFASRSATKARDPRHAAKMFKRALADRSGRWEAFHFTSHDNPHISEEALGDISRDMSILAVRQEINAEDLDEAPGALWKAAWIDDHRRELWPELVRIAVAVDPAVSDPTATKTDEVGIVAGGLGADGHGYIMRDASGLFNVDDWAKKGVEIYYLYNADEVVAEKNNGGDLVEKNFRVEDPNVPVKLVWASRGKVKRADPVAVLYSKGLIHHVGNFPELEAEMLLFTPGEEFKRSPNRADALVWLLWRLFIEPRRKIDWLTGKRLEAVG